MTGEKDPVVMVTVHQDGKPVEIQGGQACFVAVVDDTGQHVSFTCRGTWNQASLKTLGLGVARYAAMVEQAQQGAKV